MARAAKSSSRERSETAAPVSVPRETIRGIQLTVTGRELVVRLSDRIRFHRERADTLIAQMTKIAEAEHEAAEDLSGTFSTYESPRVRLEKRVREHQERASFLAFIRDHVNADDVYRLDSSDLKTADILPDRPW
jgi:hypothetical protein